MLSMLMKKRLLYLIFIVITLFVGNLNAQTIHQVESQKKIEWIEPNKVGYFTFVDKHTTQKGKFYVRGNKYVRDGEWELYVNSQLRTIVKYNRGNVVWVKYPNGRTITQEMIEIHRLKQRIKLLEKQIVKS